MTKSEIIEYLYEINTHSDLTIEQMASDLADRPQGEWKDVPPNAWRFNDIVQWHECSVCKGRSMFISNYCPHCGARTRI